MSHQQVNSQSQSGTSNFCHKFWDPPVDPWYLDNIAVAEALLKKKVKIHVKAEDDSNAQGQGQIVQSDLNVLVPVAVAIGSHRDALAAKLGANPDVE